MGCRYDIRTFMETSGLDMFLLDLTGTALGVWVSSGISGGHINPAVTIAFACCRDFPWRKVPAYVFAQVMGGLCGAGIIYANYIHAIDIVEGGRNIRTVPGTAGLFSTYAVGAFLLIFGLGSLTSIRPSSIT